MKESPLERTSVFQGVRFSVDTVLFPGQGERQRRDVVIHPGAVVILPLLDADTYVLIRNYRFAVEETLWELPAGTLEPGEPPDETAARELIEETGYRAGVLSPLTSFYSSPGICNELLHVYLATDLEYVGQQLEEGEEITVEKVDRAGVWELIRSGALRDAKSIASILYHAQFVNN